MEVKSRIEPRVVPLVSQEVLQKVSSGMLLLISGTPLISYEDPIIYYNQNTHISDMVFQPYVLSTIKIPELGHNHLNKSYIGEYPILGGQNPETETEYIFGIRPCLDFKLLDI